MTTAQLTYYGYRATLEGLLDVKAGDQVSERLDFANERSVTGDYAVRIATVVSAGHDERGERIIELDNGSVYRCGHAHRFRSAYDNLTPVEGGPLSGGTLYLADHDHAEERRRDDLSRQLDQLASRVKSDSFDAAEVSSITEALAGKLPEVHRCETWVS
jgi:hypothetical protein